MLRRSFLACAAATLATFVAARSRIVTAALSEKHTRLDGESVLRHIYHNIDLTKYCHADELPLMRRACDALARGETIMLQAHGTSLQWWRGQASLPVREAALQLTAQILSPAHTNCLILNLREGLMYRYFGGWKTAVLRQQRFHPVSLDDDRRTSLREALDSFAVWNPTALPRLFNATTAHWK